MPALTFCTQLADLIKWEDMTLSLKQKLLRKPKWMHRESQEKEPYLLPPDLDAGELRQKIRMSSVFDLRYAISWTMQTKLNISEIFEITEDIDAVARQLWTTQHIGYSDNQKFTKEISCQDNGFIPNQKFAEDTHSPYNVREAYLLDFSIK